MKYFLDKPMYLKLIKVYQNHPELWDPSNVYYHNTTLKKEIWAEISKQFNAPANILKSRINTFVRGFKREHCRIRLNAKAGKKYTPTWFAYEKLKFLGSVLKDEHVTEDENEKSTENSNFQANSSNNVEYETDKNSIVSKNNLSESNFNPGQMTIDGDLTSIEPHTSNLDGKSYKNTNDNSSFFDLNPSKKIKISNSNDSSTIFGQNISDEIEPSSNTKTIRDLYKASLTSFGLHISNEIRKFDTETQAHIKYAIHDVIYKAELKKLNHSLIDTEQPSTSACTSIKIGHPTTVRVFDIDIDDD